MLSCSCRSFLLVLAAALGLATAAAAAPPVADAGLDQTIDCALPAGAEVSLDGTGSSDPDADPLTYSWADAALTVLSTDPMPTVTLPPGVNVITLTVDDGTGSTATDTVTITVIPDVTPPVLVLEDEGDELWPPNHKLRAYRVQDLVASVSDDCTALTEDDVRFGSAHSDEADDDRGDGSTNADVQFSDGCRTADVRAERSGGGDGRVYELGLDVADDAGNPAAEVFTVAVPHDRAHGAEDSGDVAEYTSDCGEDAASCAPTPDYAGCEVAAAGDFKLRTSKKGPKLKWRASGFAAGSVSASGNAVCAYVNGTPAGGSGAPDEVKVKGKKGKGQLSVNARGAGLAGLSAAVASGAPLRLELHDGAGQCVAYEESAE